MTVSGQGMQASLEGMVSDEKGEGLPHATVLLKSSSPDGKVIKAGMTDEKGAFALTGLAPGTYVLSIHMLAYKDNAQQVLVGQQTKLEPIRLANDAHKLSEVTVTARRELIVQKPDRIIMQVGSSVLAAGNNAYNILAIAPALQVSGGSIAMQGKSNVVIFLDGKRMPGATLESVLSSLPGEQIDRVEIITSPSAKYDADASGGVIEIFTKRTKALGWDSSLSSNFSQGIRAAGAANGGFNLHSEKVNLSLSGGYNKAGHYEVGYDNRLLFEGIRPVGRLNQNKDIQNGTRQNSNFSGGLNYIPKKGNVLGVSVDWLRATADVWGTVKSDIFKADSLRSANIISQSNNQLDFANFNGFYTSQLDSVGSKLTLSANYATYQIDQNQLFRQLEASDLGEGIDIRNYAPAHFDVYTGLAEYLQVLSPRTSLESGVKYTHTLNSSKQSTLVRIGNEWEETGGGVRDNMGYSENIGAAYVNMNHLVGKSSFQAGIRAEHSRYDISPGDKATYFNLFPNLRFDYKAT
ncbi:MAG TPA: outer membrane beta-barrel protein, partial [Hymenobacter sp.]